jgi:hypothetical protein
LAKIKLYPTPHKIYNEFDRFGDLLDLKRLEGEDNARYKQRLAEVMVRRANSTYLGLIYGITRELGLRMLDVLEIVPVVDGSGNPVYPQPAIEFIDTKCYIYEDYDTQTPDITIDRFDRDSAGWTLQGLAEQINASGIMGATLLADAEPQAKSMTIYNQSNIGTITDYDISEAGIQIVLPDTNLIAGTVAITSNNLLRRVATANDLTRSGDYFINLEDGTIIATDSPAPGSTIRYQYREDRLIVIASPVIIHNLQSDDFKTKMFKQLEDEQGQYSGLPTELGADIINELLSVYPSLWGR